MFNILQLILSQPATQLFTRQIFEFNKLSNNLGEKAYGFIVNGSAT
jgi:hypothetical protein